MLHIIKRPSGEKREKGNSFHSNKEITQTKMTHVKDIKYQI